MDIVELLRLAGEHKASDLHLSAGLSPILRVDGELQPSNKPVLEHAAIMQLLQRIMTEDQWRLYETAQEVDFAYTYAGLGRFRVNAFTQARGASAVFRLIPEHIPSMEALKLPRIFQEIAKLERGLVLFTGPAGSGKSTTLASLIAKINQERSLHIITIEDPIEFLHTSQRCLISQRELHRDTKSFESALRAALREDPNIILVGELRCLETIRLAITAAETGHLVFATLHTNSCAKTLNRLVDVFPGNEKALIRSLLAESLEAVIAQRLIKKISGGRVAAFEIMLCNAAIRHLIREDKPAQIYSTMQTSQAQGMQTMEQHLAQLGWENYVFASDSEAIQRP